MKKTEQLLKKFWEASQAKPISGNATSLYINLLCYLENESTALRTDNILTSLLGITPLALKKAQDELRERSLLQFRTTPIEGAKEKDWFREYTMDEELFDKFDERIESTLSGEELEEEERKLEQLESDVQELYNSYPSKCPNRETSTGKSAKDKKKLKKLLQEKPKKELLAIIKQYVRESLDKQQYMKNFSTFLNNLPELTEQKPKPSRKGEEVDINVEIMTASEKLDWFNALRKNR